MMHRLIAITLLVSPVPAAAQWVPQRTGTTAEFRGLDAVDTAVVWAVGKGGVVARTSDGGASWAVDTIAGAERLFLVGVQARDARTAHVLGTDFEGGLSRIYRTTDAGEHWRAVWEKRGAGVFMDGLVFTDSLHGIAFGDPVGGALVIARTDDGGSRWREVPASGMPTILPGEAGFAASGRAIAARDGRAWIGTGGGAQARAWRSDDAGATWAVAGTPLAGSQTAGIFAVAFRDSLHGVAVGGDYKLPKDSSRNVLVTADGGRSWRIAGSALPAGVRYGVAYVPGPPTPTVVAVGPSGSGFSTDEGRSWQAISDEPFNTADFISARFGWAAGTEGRIARWRGPFRR